MKRVVSAALFFVRGCLHGLENRFVAGHFPEYFG